MYPLKSCRLFDINFTLESGKDKLQKISPGSLGKLNDLINLCQVINGEDIQYVLVCPPTQDYFESQLHVTWLLQDWQVDITHHMLDPFPLPLVSVQES